MSTYRLLQSMAGLQCASCLRYLVPGLEAGFVRASAHGILRLEFMEHNMVMFLSEVLRMQQRPFAPRVGVFFSAPKACLIGNIIG